MKTPFKLEIQQYPDGPHNCIADANGDWVADFGPVSESKADLANIAVDAINASFKAPGHYPRRLYPDQ